MNDRAARDTGRLALAIGAVAGSSAICLATYFAVQGPFGTINDVGNGLAGVLSGWLAWRLRDRLSGPSRGLAVAAALGGAALTVVASWLVVSGTTGFLFSGLVSSVGFAGIGTWLFILNRAASQRDWWPSGLRRLGVAAGALMALGVVTAPGIFLGLDDMVTAPAWIWIGFVGWLGIYLVYPAWAIRMGRLTTRPAGETAVERSAVAGTAR
jgi:hypothetical protein